MKADIQAHFHPDERPFVEKASEWIERAAERHAVKLTDFLDPRQLFILTSLAGRQDEVHMRADGGYADAERKRVLIAPEYIPLDHEDMRMQVLAVTSGDESVAQLTHGDYLGAILGLGIKREKIGDIHVFPDCCHYIADSEMISYLHLQLQQVHRVHVQTEIMPLSGLRTARAALEEMNFSVASLRLDGIVSDITRLSRAKALIPIKSGKCRVNWKVEEDPSKPLKQGDTISIQGFGRFKLLEVEGMTKKGRVRIKIGKFM